MNMSETVALPTDLPAAPMSRWKASAIHLLLSAVIAGSVAGVMLLVWYPWPLFEAAGGSVLTMILVGVDVALGPLVTLVIFKAGKKGLKFDLAMIAILQLSALAYGVHAVYVARPAYLVYTVDRFDLVAAVELDPEDLAKATRDEFKAPPADGPRYVAAPVPQDSAAKLKLLESALSGKDVHLFPQYYVPYEQEAHNALKRAQDLGILLERDSSRTVARYLESTGRARESVKYLPLRARGGEAAVLLDAATGAPLKIVLVNPW